MRLIHLSDIHLSKGNFEEFEEHFLKALIKDLKTYNSKIPIDIIVITGDLVDKGGHSLMEMPQFKAFKSPYDIFNHVFITPICNAIGISKEKFLFIPGNHDIDENEISYIEECKMVKAMNDSNIHTYLEENKAFVHNKRIRKFKLFEEEFHKNNISSYQYLPNQSTYIYTDGKGIKVGFLLINDSWRCKTVPLQGEEKTHYFGINQLLDGIKHLDENDTYINICLFHHSLDNLKEKKQVVSFLQNKNVELVLYGHYHSTETTLLHAPTGSCIEVRARAGIPSSIKNDAQHQSGYQIFDISPQYDFLTDLHYRIYDSSGTKEFHPDTITAPPFGVDRNAPYRNQGFSLYRNGRAPKTYNLEEKYFKLK